MFKHNPNPIVLQASQRGEHMPVVGTTAGALRKEGYIVPEEILDDAYIVKNAASPTGYAWRKPNFPGSLDPEWCLAS